MFGFLKHWLLPHERNNHRPKIIHNSSLFFIVIFLFAISYFAHVIKVSYPEILGISYSISENDLLSQVNQQRQEKGLPALTLNAQLDDAARIKAADMFAKNYWAHFAPDGSTSPWEFIKASGYNYQFAGENLAKGFTDSSSIVAAWMNSPSHRDNILSTRYRDVGFAIVPGSLQGEDTVLVVEMFGATPNEIAAVPAAAAAVAVSGQGVIRNPKVDAATTSKAASSVALAFLIFAFFMDLIITERKKIPRIVGHNLDHIMLIAAFILFLIIMEGGVTL